MVECREIQKGNPGLFRDYRKRASRGKSGT
jgi:hypothetical protein